MDYYFDTEQANTVSREHSIVEFKNGRMYISNRSNTNPTYLNNDKVNAVFLLLSISADLVILMFLLLTYYTLCIQQVIRQTEVEEGDLIGFGM
jgi:hypothetical protein